MLELKIQEVARRKGITNAYQFALKVGCGHSKAARLWNGGQEFPKLETLNELCAALGCKLWDLITWTPDKTQKPLAQNGRQKRRK